MRIDHLKLNEILEQYETKVENLLPILLDVQNESEGRFIDSETARLISERVKIPYSQMSEVLSFFAAINKTPKGKYHIEMCNSTVCRVNDNHLIENYLKETLGIAVGETTDDELFSLDYAPCFGACDISPSVRINKRAYGHLTVDKLKVILEKFRGEAWND